MRSITKNTNRVAAIVMAVAMFLSVVGPQMAFAETAGIKQIASGYYHTVILKTDGTVWTAGQNNYGQLGDGTKTSRSTFAQVASDVEKIVARENNTFIIKNDGTLWGAGANDNHQLGGLSVTSSTVFKQMLVNVVDVVPGNSFLVALRADGGLIGIGDNTFGQLGMVSPTTQTAFKLILTGVSQVSIGDSHTMALKTDGTLWASGYNVNSQLGDGTTTDAKAFKQVLTNVKSISTGSAHSLAIKTDGTLWAAGFNASGQLGDGTKTNARTFKQVATEVKGLFTSSLHGGSYTMIVKNDDSLWTTGYNGDGWLGVGPFTYSSTTSFKRVAENIRFAKSGNKFTMLITNDGKLLSSGGNHAGQLGNGTTEPSYVFGQVLDDVVQVTTGMYYAIALKSDGSLWATGQNNAGQHGNGTTTSTASFVQIMEPSYAPTPTPLELANEAVSQAEVTKTQEDVNAAQLLVTNLPDGEDKISLQGRLNIVQMIVDATIAVGVAEQSVTQEAVDSATVLVEALPEGTDKTSLQERLAAIQNLLDAEFVEMAVGIAEMTREQSDVDFAQLLISDLGDGETKSALQQRLDAVQAIIDATNAVVTAETQKTSEAIAAAEAAVGALPESDDKAVLVARIDDVKASIGEPIAEGSHSSSTTGNTDGSTVINIDVPAGITMSLDTNVINFDAADPTQAAYNKFAAIGVNIQSSNTYRLMAKALDDFKTAGETPLVMSVDHLKAKVGTESNFLAMSKHEDVVLIQNQPNTSGTQYELDFRFDSDWQAKPGNYSTTIKITASQL